MDSIWVKTKTLEGETLYTLMEESPFRIIKVLENKLVFQTSGGGEFRVTKKLLEKVCHHVINGGETSVESLAKARITKRKREYTYLPAIIEAILER